MKKRMAECASVPCELPEDVADTVDELVKGLPSECKQIYIRKAYESAYQFEPGERSEVSIITTATKDKQDEVVLSKGIDLTLYRRNPIVLYNHDKFKAIGSCGWIKHFGEDQIRAKTIYPIRPPDVEIVKWLTDDVWSLLVCQPPILRSKSIGAIPTKPLREPTKEELELHPDWEGAGIWEEMKLLEYSCCHAGVNNDSLVLAVNNKSVNCEVLKSLGIDVPASAEQPIISEEAVADKAPIMSVDEAIAYTMKHLKPIKKKRKAIDFDALLAKAVDELDIDSIVSQVVDNWKHRGKV